MRAAGKKLVLLSAVFGVAATAAAGACNVKIDASVLDDAGADGFASSVVGCHAQAECKSVDPCVTARCDEGAAQCVFEVCPTGDQCGAASCTTLGKCGVTTTFGYHAGSFRVPQGLGCATCAAAVFPFFFVATQLDVLAFRVSDPSNGSPPQPHFARLPFAPRAMLTSGRRVYFVGAPNGANTSPYQLQVAWLDVPADPGVKSLEARVSTFPHPSPDLRLDGVLAGADDQLFSFRRVQTYENNQSVMRDYELLMRVTTNPDPGGLNFFLAKGYPATGRTVAVSNGRLVVFDALGGIGALSFDVKPGTNDAQNTGDQQLPDMGTPGASTFAVAPDGGVYWSAALRKPIVPNQAQQIGGVRLALALTDGSSSTFSAQARTDLEVYEPGLIENPGGPTAPNPFVGPIASMGTGAAIALAAARENVAQTSVQLVQKNGANIQLAPGKRFLVPARVDQVAVAGTDRFGYVVTPDTAQSMTVHIFSASCQ